MGYFLGLVSYTWFDVPCSLFCFVFFCVFFLCLLYTSCILRVPSLFYTFFCLLIKKKKGMGLLRMIFQDGRLLEFVGKVVKGPMDNEIVVMFEGMESSEAIRLSFSLVREDCSFDFFVSKLFKFSSFVEMWGFQNCLLFKEIVARKRFGDKPN